MAAGVLDVRQLGPGCGGFGRGPRKLRGGAMDKHFAWKGRGRTVGNRVEPVPRRVLDPPRVWAEIFLPDLWGPGLCVCQQRGEEDLARNAPGRRRRPRPDPVARAVKHPPLFPNRHRLVRPVQKPARLGPPGHVPQCICHVCRQQPPRLELFKPRTKRTLPSSSSSSSSTISIVSIMISIPTPQLGGRSRASRFAAYPLSRFPLSPPMQLSTL